MFTSCLILILAAFCITESTLEENLGLQRLFPISNDEQLNINKRFQQIMQSGNPADVGWPQPPKIKTETIDVRAEIKKLNTSYIYQSSWPKIDIKLGAVTAVSFDISGNVVIFHRCDRVWNDKTFDYTNVYRDRSNGTIRDSTVLVLTREEGHLVHDWGKNLFYMPHGLTVDHENNVWVTDVALHQVFKFGPNGSDDKPLMSLGTPFTPGNGEKFCKPTSVAVLENGDFFIADGYCNARILKYTKNGDKILSWGQNTFAGVSYDYAPPNYFAIPHALTLVPEQELICVSDRENGRVQCFMWTNGTFHSQYHNQIIGDRLFSMDYTPAEGGQLVVVNGPVAEIGVNSKHYNEVRGYILNMRTRQVTSKFGPNDLKFKNPHDVAVTKDGNEIYVAELNPMRIHKFLHKTIAKTISISAAKPTATTGLESDAVVQTRTTSDALFKSSNNTKTEQADNNDTLKRHSRPGGTAILVVSSMLVFAFLTFAIALLIARRRKRACLPFGTPNRRHAWDFPAKSEGFKLGGLLRDRGRRSGFEKLDQNASDEEEEVTTNMLTSAEFA